MLWVSAHVHKVDLNLIKLDEMKRPEGRKKTWWLQRIVRWSSKNISFIFFFQRSIQLLSPLPSHTLWCSSTEKVNANRNITFCLCLPHISSEMSFSVCLFASCVYTKIGDFRAEGITQSHLQVIFTRKWFILFNTWSYMIVLLETIQLYQNVKQNSEMGEKCMFSFRQRQRDICFMAEEMWYNRV